MMRAFHIDPGSKVFVEIDTADLGSVRRGGGWTWVDVVGADDSEREQVCADFGFDPLATEDVLAVTEHPKADDYPDHSFIVLHGLADDTTRLRTVEYDSFVGADYLVTFRREELHGFDWLRQQMLQPGHPAPESPDRLFALLVGAGATRFNVLIDALEERIEDLEQQALAGHPGVIGEVHVLRRDGLRLRRVLVPQRDTIRRLAADEFPAIGARARMRLRSAQDQYSRAAESLEASQVLLIAVLDTYRATVAERANEVMKVLTVFAAILLPLSVIAGIYGMNFANMPELNWRWAYFGALGLMAAVALSLWAHFARRGFIGGPKLGRIPKALGLGLAGLIRLTTHPVDTVGRMLTDKQ
jgi:magnesium transporter